MRDLFLPLGRGFRWIGALAPVAAPALFLLTSPSVAGVKEEENVRYRIVGDALLGEDAYAFLSNMTDSFGPRMIGTVGHAESLNYLQSEVEDLGWHVERQVFTFPGWERGVASVEIVSPFERELRAVELGYSRSGYAEGTIAYIDSRDVDTLLERKLEGRVLLLKPNLSFSHAEMERLAEAGAVAALLTNRVAGGQLLARVANHGGESSPIPMLSITQEEGLWLKRLRERDASIVARIRTGATHREMEGVNLVATLPGELEETILIGAHFDSWDLGQGAIDNGLGVAQLVEVARLFSRHSPVNRRTIKLVWFDAEEFGLWGSRRFVEARDLAGIRLMLNLDMVGEPIALNAMGFNELVDPLQRFSDSLGSWRFARRLENKPWLGSDHYPFLLKGVPSVTFNAPLDHEDSRYYHDLGDTLDKIDREMLGRASAIIALFVYEFANRESLSFDHLSKIEVEQLLRDAGLEERLRRSGQWPFEDQDKQLE